MLAIISMLVLQTEHGHVFPISDNEKTNSAQLTSPGRPGNVDYFSLAKPTMPSTSASFPWAIPSPRVPLPAPSISSSNSSRGSWSSLFNTGTVRQFMSGVQDTLKEGLLTPSEVPLPATTPEIQITSPVRSIGDSNSSSRPRKRRTRNNSSFTPTSVVSKSWSVSSLGYPSRKTTLGDQQLSPQFVDSSQVTHEKRVVFEPPAFNES